jgi:hypothetical protein
MVDRVTGRLSLTDLDGVSVMVEEPVPPGFVAEALKTEAEARLKAAGIKLLPPGSYPTGDPHLRLTVGVSSAVGRLVAANVQVDFVQIVFLRRNPQVTFSTAQTWKADAQLLLLPSTELRDGVRRELARQLDQFIEDCRTVNG